MRSSPADSASDDSLMNSGLQGGDRAGDWYSSSVDRPTRAGQAVTRDQAIGAGRSSL